MSPQPPSDDEARASPDRSPTIGEVVASLEVAAFAGRRRELEEFERWLVRSEGVPETLNVTGPGGIGKSTLLLAFGRLAEEAGHSAAYYDLEAILSPEELRTQLEADTTEEAAEHLNEYDVVLLDLVEPGDLLRFLATELMPRVRTSTRIVVSGRRPLARIVGPWSWPTPVRSLMLRGLAHDEAREMLAKTGITAPREVEQILAVAGGHPLALTLAAEMVGRLGVRRLHSAPAWHQSLSSLVGAFFEEDADPELRELLEACAVVRQVDEEVLERLTERNDVREAFGKLAQLSIVRSTPYGLMLHQDVRGLLAQDLRWRRPERYAALRGRAIADLRERSVRAGPEDREHLLAERLALWENAIGQALMFPVEESDEYWLDHPAPEEIDDVIELEQRYHTQVAPTVFDLEYQHGYTAELHRRLMEELLRHPATRIRVVRTGGGEVLGYNAVMALTRDSIEVAARNPAIGPVVRAYAAEHEPALQDSPEDARIHLVVQATALPGPLEGPATLVIRDVFSVLVRGGVLLLSATLDAHKQLMTALGFRPVPGAVSTVWGDANPFEGFALDLRGIGVEAWTDALLSGRPPPAPVSRDEIRSALQEALAGWPNHGALERSVLASLVAGSGERADAVRDAIRQSLDLAATRGNDQDRRALETVRRAYMERSGSHEVAARDMHLSRPTFYRLLRRGTDLLTAGWFERARIR